MRLVFVSEMRNPYTDASSTQIMTRNLLYGFRQICDYVLFVPVIEKNDDKGDIEKTYSELCDEIVFVGSLTKPHAKPLTTIISSLAALIHFSKKKIPSRLYKVNDFVLVSHSPSIDSILICNEICKKCNVDRYIQYWGDPYALSLITPEEYYYRRVFDKFIEKKLLSMSSNVVYGTKSLYDAQIKFYPEIKEKASYVDVAYSPESKNSSLKHSKTQIGYFGNYYSHIRNIIPFYEASLELKNCDVTICGDSDIHLSSSNSVKVYGRVSQAMVVNFEQEIDVVVCILNKKGVQIPGKIFYQTNTNKDILVILDGPQKNAILEELNKSGRFIFCDNNKDSILKSLNMLTENCSKKVYKTNFYSPVRICKKILDYMIEE